MINKQCHECKHFNLHSYFCAANIQKDDTELPFYMAVSWDDLACHKFKPKNQSEAPSFMDKLRRLAGEY